jgi:hypothetical protein
MTSKIDVTKPTHWNPKTADIRANFQIAADEISSIQTTQASTPVNFDIDGGGAITVFEIKAQYLDGGTAGVVHGTTDQTFDFNVTGTVDIDGGNAI